MLDTIKKYKRAIRFHTPGHKGKYFGVKNLTELDITELEYSDNLLEPTGIIKQAQENAAKYFGVQKTFFVTSGSTTSILISLYAACLAVREAKQEKEASQEKKDANQAGNTNLKTYTPIVLFESGCHPSVKNGCLLAQAKTVTIENHEYCEQDSVTHAFNNQDNTNQNNKKSTSKSQADINNICQDEIPLPLTLNQIQTALEQNPNIDIVVVTSPNYYGQVADIKQIHSECKKRGITLIIDSAHGAHFNCIHKENLPSQHSDISILSGHKTLPCLTGGSYLNVSNKSLIKYIDKTFGIFHTTSPLYPTLISLDLAIKKLEKNGQQLYEKLRKKVELFRLNIGKIKQIVYLQNADFTRIVLHTKYAKQLEKYLAEQSIFCERASKTEIVFIATFADKASSFRKLYKAIKTFFEQIENTSI